MADDIVNRLRYMAWTADEGEPWTDVALQAADEIQRLRSLVEDLRADRDHWCRMATAT